MISGNSNSGSNKNLVRSIRMDFTVKRGDTFSYVYDVSAIDANGNETTADLTGYYAQMHLKKNRTDTHYFTAMATNISTTAGTITFYKSAEDMQITAGTYWYDLEIKDADGINVTWIEGKFKILQDITEWVDEIEKKIKAKIESVLEFVKGKVKRYPVIIGYYHLLVTSSKSWAKIIMEYERRFIGNRAIVKSAVKFFDYYLFSIASRYLKFAKINIKETFAFFVSRLYRFRVLFESDYNFEFTQVYLSVIEFYETYRFYSVSSGYTELTES